MSIISKIFIENNVFLKRFLRRFLDSEHDVEDVLQDAYIKAAIAEKSQIISKPKAFVFTIAKNLALTELKKKSKRIQEDLDDCILSSIASSANLPDLELEAQQHLKMYCDTINLLPKKTKKVYIYRKVYGLKHKEIAEKMDISLSSVEKHLKLAILCCKDILQRKNALTNQIENRLQVHKEVSK